MLNERDAKSVLELKEMLKDDDFKLKVASFIEIIGVIECELGTPLVEFMIAHYTSLFNNIGDENDDLNYLSRMSCSLPSDCELASAVNDIIYKEVIEKVVQSPSSRESNYSQIKGLIDGFVEHGGVKLDS